MYIFKKKDEKDENRMTDMLLGRANFKEAQNLKSFKIMLLLWHLYHICTKYVLIVMVPQNFGGTAHVHEHGVIFPEVKHSSQVTVGSHRLGPLRVFPRVQERNAFPRVPWSFQVNRVVKHTLVHERHLGVDVIITFLLY